MNESSHQQLQRIKWRQNNKFACTIPIADDGLSLRSQTNTPKAKSTHVWVPQSTLIPLPFFCFPIEIRIIKMQRDSKTRQNFCSTQTMGSYHLSSFLWLVQELKLLIPETKECVWNLLWFVQVGKTLMPCIVNFWGVEINHLFGNRTLFRSSNFWN